MNNKQAFNEMLKQELIKKKKIKQNKAIFQNPISLEKQYLALLKRNINKFIKITIQEIKPILSSWVSENSQVTNVDGEYHISEYQNNIDWYESILDRIDNIEVLHFDSPTDELNIINNEFDRRQQEQNEELVRDLTAIALLLSRYNRSQSEKFIKTALGIDFSFPIGDEEEIIKVWVSRNVNLIKGLSNDYIKQINETILNGFQNDITANELAKSLTKVNKNFSINRTKLIARDQTSKLNSQLSMIRQKSVGVSLYEWFTSVDERVRGNPAGKYPNAIPSHWVMHGKICRWDDATVYADTVNDALAGNWKKRSSIGGVQLHPGQAIQCRCTAGPIFVDIVNDITEKFLKPII